MFKFYFSFFLTLTDAAIPVEVTNSLFDSCGEIKKGSGRE
jgi:hypothetical protein